MNLTLSGPRLHRLVPALLLVSFACGGDSPSSSDYPAIKGTYGSYGPSVGLTGPGLSHQHWIAPDGTQTTRDCNAVIGIPNQNGASFSGSVDRLQPCGSQATLAGEIAHDGTFRFTLTQARWESCTAAGPVEYTGIVTNGNLLANGRLSVQCDDGRAMTIEEQITGSLSVPPTTG